MSDFKGMVLGVAVLLTPALLWHFLLERPIRKLYTPPGGGWLLVGTWGLALSIIPLAYSWRFDHPYIGGVITVLAIPVALFLTIIYRDQWHAIRGLDPAVAGLPARFGVFSRIIWGIIGTMTSAVAVWFAFQGGFDWEMLLFLGSLATTFLGIAWKGTIPAHLRESVGRPARPKSQIDAG